jgi:hypothetical protein
MAQDYLIDYLLRANFLMIPKAKRLEVAGALLDRAMDTSHFTGTAQDDFEAEAIAEVVVDAQSRVDQAIGQALQAAEDAEGSRWPPT